MKLKHPAARHILCAWNIPTETFHDGVSYCEDEEYGIGSAILQTLIDNGVTHRAIFAIRYCGEKLQNDRIDTYMQAVKAVIKQAPYNSIVRCEQQIKEDDQKNPRQAGGPRRGTNNYRGRGRGFRGGRGGGGRKINEEKRKYSPPSFRKDRITDALTQTKNKQSMDNETYADAAARQMDIN